jgi:hypothetical protein
MIRTTLRTAIIAATLALGAATVAVAQTAPARPAMAVAPPASRLVNVSLCDAQRSVAMPAYVGFSQAYYPFAPYYWTDPYGFQYRQYPAAPTSGTLSIDYMNGSTQVMTTIDFGLVARGRLVAEVRDVGKFSPNAEIKHQFGVSNNVFPLRTALAQCLPLHIIYANGTTWTNPHLPRARHEIYGK